MKNATLTRVDDIKQTLGVFSVDNGGFTCKSLELAWKNNEAQVSCIPCGSYVCKWTKSPRMTREAGHDVFTYEILNVPNRGGVRIHSGNYAFKENGKPDSLGCPLFGSDYKDLNGDGVLDITNSKNTIEAFHKYMDKEDFLLTIKNVNSQKLVV